jgi:hypothetical protein
MADFDPMRRLKEIARDVEQIPLQMLKEKQKVFLICVNTYKSYQLNLGSSPMADAFELSRQVKKADYEIFYLQNVHAATFLDYFDAFLQLTKFHLIFLYVGRGTSVADLNGDETDGRDEALVFDDRLIIDDDLVTHLVRNKNPSSVLTLLTDALHKDTIWNMTEKAENGEPIPALVRSLSAETKLQTMTRTFDAVIRVEKGAFTHALAQGLRSKLKATPKDLEEGVRSILAEAGQVYSFGTTSPELLDEPLLL